MSDVNPLHWTPEQWGAVRWYDEFLRTYAADRPEAQASEGRALRAIFDIAAHSTPFGEDDDGFVNGGYLVSVGAMHRAFGILGHTAAPCATCPSPDAVLARETDGKEVAG